MKKIIITFVSIIIIILLIDLMLYKNNNEYTKFKSSLDKAIGSNIYEVISINRSLEILNNESGILFYTTNDDLDYAEYLNDLTKDFNIDKVYYIDLTNDNKNKSIIDALEDNIEIEDEIIKTPILLIVKDGVLSNITIFDKYKSSELDKRLIRNLSSYYYDNKKVK